MITKPTKYTEEVVLKIMTEAWELLKNDKPLNKFEPQWEIDTIAGLSSKLELWREWWTKYVKIYSDNTEISHTWVKIKNELEFRLSKQALNGTVKERMAIFLMKCNHGFVETDRHEHTGLEGKELNAVDYSKVPEEVLAAFIQSQKDNEDEE